MAELSPVDIELLSSALPELRRAVVDPRLYPDHRGLIEYRSAGDRDKPVVLCLHGLGSSSDGYRAQLAGLSADFHVVAWNAPGFGASSQIEAQDIHIDDYAAALEAFLRASKIDRLAALVGSSWGSVVAVAFAARYPDLVESIVLSAPSRARGHLTGAQRESELNSRLQAADVSIPVSRAEVADRLIAPQATAPVRRHVERLRDGMTTSGWRQAIRSLFSVSLPEIVPAVRCRIDLLVGTEDQVAPYQENARLIHEAVPKARLHWFDGCGHILKLEGPEKFNAIVRAVAAPA
ncbi:pimeloyl-ACP methyl ester carboxylesterase [Bradyrhizobium diazoefficiens]|uniref:alpha/beta fold hydrolase n=1 Tax=Bradyrhizobium TaxID=374 RepID=UPI0013A59B53|nr:alpha/beta hydrolase [Bradyrhizobium diazoefficiens]AWO93251.2 alpha/beta hydrolase [Bradyrhizobium diazoefficiens]